MSSKNVSRSVVAKAINDSSITTVDPSSSTSFLQQQEQLSNDGNSPAVMGTIREDAGRWMNIPSEKQIEDNEEGSNDKRDDTTRCSSYAYQQSLNHTNSYGTDNSSHTDECHLYSRCSLHREDMQVISSISLNLSPSHYQLQNGDLLGDSESVSTPSYSSSKCHSFSPVSSTRYQHHQHYHPENYCQIYSCQKKRREKWCGRNHYQSSQDEDHSNTTPAMHYCTPKVLITAIDNDNISSLRAASSSSITTNFVDEKTDEEEAEVTKSCCCCFYCLCNCRKRAATNKKKKRKSHKRLTVFMFFIFFILGALAAFFCWPRTPRITMGEGGPVSISGPPDWWSGQQQYVTSAASELTELPARPSLRATWQLNVTLDNRDNWIPTHFTKIDFVLLDSLTLAKFAKSSYPPESATTANSDSSFGLFQLASGTISTLTLTFNVYYQAVDRTDPTLQNLFNACGPISNESKEKRPALNVLLKVYFHIFGISWVPTVTAAPYTGGILCPTK
ncbi:hypothetical protein BDF20DRAFT_915541 [Mycotypha africana]|uniref:uncharacterized protein n=1 Tax=Mycotypha africana TaxID=64632 RepID=UPI00230069B5|nr:uncharacterized protein BDF20DRAFT_915541 [Mycotypha africana]KAI8971768.1 hypothetical protein BDF20DRAFT_915541 [Mycotypha africana]